MKAVADQKKNQIDVFWGEIAPCEHLVQIYEEDEVFLDTVEGFVAGGIQSGDSVIAIATKAHLAALEDRLKERGIDLDEATALDRYIPLNAEQTLSKFIVAGWPDEDLFQQVISELLARARKNGKRVRAFGEMVAVLWSRGHNSATVRLEHLWHHFCQKEAFSLFCAYPKCGFTKDADASMQEICAAHSRLVPGVRS
jgi:hypothetical protein